MTMAYSYPDGSMTPTNDDYPSWSHDEWLWTMSPDIPLARWIRRRRFPFLIIRWFWRWRFPFPMTRWQFLKFQEIKKVISSFCPFFDSSLKLISHSNEDNNFLFDFLFDDDELLSQLHVYLMRLADTLNPDDTAKIKKRKKKKYIRTHKRSTATRTHNSSRNHFHSIPCDPQGTLKTRNYW